jgi:hypothetical protein
VFFYVPITRRSSVQICPPNQFSRRGTRGRTYANPIVKATFENRKRSPSASTCRRPHCAVAVARVGQPDTEGPCARLLVRITRSWATTAGQIGSENNFRIVDSPGSLVSTAHRLMANPGWSCTVCRLHSDSLIGIVKDSRISSECGAFDRLCQSKSLWRNANPPKQVDETGI